MPTTLFAGDIAFTGFNFDNPDEFSFVLLTDITAGTEISFTDNGWLSLGAFRDTEGTFTWAAPGDLSAGTVVIPAVSGVAFSALGDQIHAYQGDATSPSFIASIHSNGSIYEEDATSSNTSALPTGLVLGQSAVAIPEVDNAVYVGITSGTREELQAAINDPSNWSGSNSTRVVQPTGPFTVGDPEPELIAFDLRNSADQNLLSFTNFAPAFASAGDAFGVLQRPDGPFAVYDDSASIFTGDTQGIIDESNVDTFFGIVDIDNGDNPSGEARAEWEFDVSGFTALTFSVDIGAMGDFEASGGSPDGFRILASLDGAPEVELFASNVDEGATQTYTLESGTEVTLDDPLLVDGTALSNVLQTFSAGIAGAGSVLTIALEASGDGGTEAVALQNLEITGVADGSGPQPAVLLSDLSLVADEGDPLGDAYEVTLATAPSAPVTIEISTGPDLDVVPATLTFDAENFATPQVVSVTAVDDDLPELAEIVDIDHTVSSDDADYDGLAVPVVEVAVSASDIEFVSIYEIQGAGHVSEFVLGDGQSVQDFFATLPEDTLNILGEFVTTEGVVTATDSNGFYLQDATGDGDDATSDAIFVFTGARPSVAEGDAITITAQVAEFFPGDTDSRNLPTTQLTNVSEITVESTGNALPTAVRLGEDPGERSVPNTSIDDDAFTAYEPGEDGIDFFESLEGMLVTATDLVAVSGTNRFGEIYAVADGGAGATGLSDRGTLNISPDDFNPEKIQIDEDSGIFDFDLPEVNAGDALGDMTGVVNYSFGYFEILPTMDFTATVEPGPLTAETTELTGSANELTVATYNVLNLDPNDGDGDTDVADGRFDAIAAQIVGNLGSPDIVGLQEVQDNNGSSNDGTTSASETLALLAAAIEAAGGPSYAVIDNTFITDNASGGQPGGNIRTAFLYNPDRVDLVEGSVQTIGGQGEGEAFEGARLPLVAEFAFNGETVTVVNNHFSSKGGSAPILGIEQDFTARQEDVSVNGSLDERQAQSRAVQDFVEGLAPGANVAVLGDFNEFEFVSPVLELETNSGLNNLTNDIDEDERYSFIFQGNSQSLDHILVSDSLDETAEVDIVHVNSEFAATASRASDHDPIVARFFLPGTETLAVELESKGFFRSVASELIDGVVVDTDRIGALRNELRFTDVGIDVNAIDPTDPELLTILKGQIGIRSLDDGFFGRDTRAVDGDEALSFSLRDSAREAVEFEFSFGSKTREALVEVAFFDEGALVGTLAADAADGDFSGDLGRSTFDEVRLSALDGTEFTVDSFVFTVVEDEIFV
ncbi:MAG: endonuclease/exonuclease/phosphatase family protein [Pseudomonadota bacterium]